MSFYVPVVGSTGEPLMPCHPARARQLVRLGKALRRFNNGIFYIKLTERTSGDIQTIAVGVDPGSKREGYTVKSESRTYLNIQAHAVQYVTHRMKSRRELRRTRRLRKTPYRKARANRKQTQQIPPSIKSRWDWKLRICKWLAKVYPIEVFVVEDICYAPRGQKYIDTIFVPLQQGKDYFYRQLGEVGRVITLKGYETKELRDAHGLYKNSKKLAEVFSAHCVDSWVLANWFVGGHLKPDNTSLMLVKPYGFYKRQLHRLQPKNGYRSRYGGTMSLGFKRGSIVKNIKTGVRYVGGNNKGKLSLYCLKTGKIKTHTAAPSECIFLTYSPFRAYLLKEGK